MYTKIIMSLGLGILFSTTLLPDVVSYYAFYAPFTEKKVILFGTDPSSNENHREQTQAFQQQVAGARTHVVILNGMVSYREGVTSYEKGIEGNIYDRYWDKFNALPLQDRFLVNLSMYYSHRFCPSISFMNSDPRIASIFFDKEFYRSSLLSSDWDYKNYLKKCNALYLPLCYEKNVFEEMSLNSLLELYNHSIALIDNRSRLPVKIDRLYRKYLNKLKKQKEKIRRDFLQNFSEAERELPLAKLIYENKGSVKLSYFWQLLRIFNSECFSKAFELNALYHIYTSTYPKIIVCAEQKHVETIATWLQKHHWLTRGGNDRSIQGIAISRAEFEIINNC